MQRQGPIGPQPLAHRTQCPSLGIGGLSCKRADQIAGRNRWLLFRVALKFVRLRTTLIIGRACNQTAVVIGARCGQHRVPSSLLFPHLRDLRRGGIALGNEPEDIGVDFVLWPCGRFPGMDRNRKLSCFDFSIKSWLGVFDAPLFEIVPTEELYWRLIHSLVLVQTTHHCVSQEQMAHSVREK